MRVAGFVDQIPDAISCILHTIMLHRAIGRIAISEVESDHIPGLNYLSIAPDVNSTQSPSPSKSDSCSNSTNISYSSPELIAWAKEVDQCAREIQARCKVLVSQSCSDQHIEQKGISMVLYFLNTSSSNNAYSSSPYQSSSNQNPQQRKSVFANILGTATATFQSATSSSSSTSSAAPVPVPKPQSSVEIKSPQRKNSSNYYHQISYEAVNPSLCFEIWNILIVPLGGHTVQTNTFPNQPVNPSTSMSREEMIRQQVCGRLEQQMIKIMDHVNTKREHVPHPMRQSAAIPFDYQLYVRPESVMIRPSDDLPPPKHQQQQQREGSAGGGGGKRFSWGSLGFGANLLKDPGTVW